VHLAARNHSMCGPTAIGKSWVAVLLPRT
jgi:hypothetical protein